MLIGYAQVLVVILGIISLLFLARNQPVLALSCGGSVTCCARGVHVVLVGAGGL